MGQLDASIGLGLLRFFTYSILFGSRLKGLVSHASGQTPPDDPIHDQSQSDDKD